MDDKKLNEKESLELIAQMIQNTRRNLNVGSSNMFLLWGYLGVIVTFIVWIGIFLTNDLAWLWGFWAIPVLSYPLKKYLNRNSHQVVKSLLDEILYEVWRMFGGLCIGLLVPLAFGGQVALGVPLCAFIIVLGSITTGIILRYKIFYFFPTMALLIVLAMVVATVDGGAPVSEYLSYLVTVIVLSVIIPGHLLKYKVKKDLKKTV